MLSLLHQAREEGYQSSQVPCQKVIRYSFKAGWAGHLCSIIAQIIMGLRFNCLSPRMICFLFECSLAEFLCKIIPNRETNEPCQEKLRLGSSLVFFHKFCSFIQKLIDSVGRSRTRINIQKKISQYVIENILIQTIVVEGKPHIYHVGCWW